MLVGGLCVTAALAASAVALYRSSFRITSRCWIRALCRCTTREKVVALTFDDGVDRELTPQVLDVLRDYGVEACFFVVGDRVDAEVLQRMDREGHIIGNHTLHHSGLSPFDAVDKMVDDAAGCDDAIRSATGHSPRLFRPPFGVSNPRIGEMVRRRGYIVIGWSIRSFDTRKGSRHAVAERIAKQLHPGAVILLHDNREGAPELLRDLLELLKKEGYAVLRVDKLFETEPYENEK